MILGKSNTLTRECIATLCTTAGVLFFSGALIVQWIGNTEIQKVFLLVPILMATGVVVAASLRFRNRLSTTSRLEQQIAGVSAVGSSIQIESLHSIIDNTPIGKNWNQLVKLFQEKKADDAIERRIASESKKDGGNQRFARAFRSMQEGIAISDIDGRISYVNTAWENIVVDSDSLLGGSIVDCLKSNNFMNWDDASPEFLSGSRPMTWELRCGFTIADGVVQLGRTPLEGRSDESEGFVWTLKDITQQALVRDSHEQFLGSATHELRTPITNIKGYAESLIEVDDISPDQQKEFFNIIHSEANRLGRLLNELLDIQQLEAGSMTLSTSPFDVLRMIQEVQEQISPLIADKDLKLISRIPPDLKTIEADKEKIISCLINLLGNAIKYTPSGGEVRVQAEQQEDSISISVEDTGIGIAESELPKIFDRFYRCQDKRVSELEGNGLGLAFSMEVARLHNGELKVDSQLDRGSRFTLVLPMKAKS